MWGGTWDVRRFDEIDSTNAYLRRVARDGAPEGVVAVADHQSAGRGRMDRRWESPPGASLLVSVLFRPDFDPSELHLCTAAVALAAAEACRRVAGVGPVIKWPNDLVVGDAKLAGVLAEAEFLSGSCALVVGLGLNVVWPGPDGVGGTCLNDLSAAAVDRGRPPRGPPRRPLRPPGPPRHRGGTAGGGRRAAPTLRHAGTAGEGRTGGARRGGGGRRGRRRRSSGGADRTRTADGLRGRRRPPATGLLNHSPR